MEFRDILNKITLLEGSDIYGRGIYSTDIDESPSEIEEPLEEEIKEPSDDKPLDEPSDDDNEEEPTIHSLATRLVNGEIDEDDFLNSIKSFIPSKDEMTNDELSQEEEPLSTDDSKFQPDDKVSENDDDYIRTLRESYKPRKKTIEEGCNPELEECDGMSEDSTPENNVKMTIDGQGVNGIRDLLNLLSTKDNPSTDMNSDEDDIILFGDDEDSMYNDDEDSRYNDDEDISEPLDDDFDNIMNSVSDTNYFPIDDITKQGDDLHSKGNTSFPKQSGGDNAMNIREGLLKLYRELKNG